MTLEQIVPWLAGLFGVPLVQFLKKLLDVSGNKAMWLTTATSFVLAILAALLTNGGLESFLDPAGIFEATAKIMAVAVLFYKSIVSKT